MATNKEVYVQKVSNPAEITAGSLYIIDLQEQAIKSDYLPFNKLRVFNKSAVEVQVFYETYGNGTLPDFVLGAGTGVDVSVLEGENFNVLVFKNMDGAVSIAANELKIRMSSVREVL